MNAEQVILLVAFLVAGLTALVRMAVRTPFTADEAKYIAFSLFYTSALGAFAVLSWAGVL